jgi:menaquinone-specific isochorismate synthase
VIRDIEPMTRGRYAAPVGWLDGNGDGEFAIALRCAQVNGRSVRLMAGCGIVADSDPETEAREAQIKMIPIRDALEARV